MLGVRFEHEWTEVGESLGRSRFRVPVVKLNLVFAGGFEGVECESKAKFIQWTDFGLHEQLFGAIVTGESKGW